MPGDTTADPDAIPDVTGDEVGDPDAVEDTAEDTIEDLAAEDAIEDTIMEIEDALDIPADDPDAPVPCAKDDECELGAEWCVGGYCVPCDNTGTICDLACMGTWEFYTRNGCLACECAPLNACTKDSDCLGEMTRCYAGAFCWDWCVPPDPACCMGNICSLNGCTEPPPVGCFTRG